jgi:heat shock protein HtpX
MSITFIDIERQKSWRIALFFSVLIALYILISFALVASFYPLFPLSGFSLKALLQRPAFLIVVLISSVITALIHFCLSSLNAVSYIKKSLSALLPDPEDEIHRQLVHIVDEIQIASGRKINIQCLVIPSISVNALSAVDLRGTAIIAITEGLLSRISRAQLETVIAHEAYHILSGDCLETTIAASLFGIPSAAIEKASNASEGRIFLMPAFLFAWLMVKVSCLLNMFISREREYRADAGAVRMTRNPLALAEVLYLLSHRWKGIGHIGAGIEMLCIMNTSDSVLDESDGWFADLISTHPPVNKRIKILLQMAHTGIATLSRKMDEDENMNLNERPEDMFYALDNKYQWQGPFTIMELAVLPWLSADTWICNNTNALAKASQMPLSDVILRRRFANDAAYASGYLCPSCRNPLLPAIYERTQIYHCRFCGGSLVEDVKLPRIIARKDIKYSERINALSRTTLSENQTGMLARNRNNFAKVNMNFLYCPKCRNRMTRTFYSMAYLVELDRCGNCGLVWFEKDELEILQCMIDNRMASTPMPSQEAPQKSNVLNELPGSN